MVMAYLSLNQSLFNFRITLRGFVLKLRTRLSAGLVLKLGKALF